MFHLCSFWLIYENPIYNTNRFVLQEQGILLGGCLMEHLARNETNYFMYQWAGPVSSYPQEHPTRIL